MIGGRHKSKKKCIAEHNESVQQQQQREQNKK